MSDLDVPGCHCQFSVNICFRTDTSSIATSRKTSLRMTAGKSSEICLQNQALMSISLERKPSKSNKEIEAERQHLEFNTVIEESARIILILK